MQGKLEQQIMSTKCRKKGIITRRIWGNKRKMQNRVSKQVVSVKSIIQFIKIQTNMAIK